MSIKIKKGQAALLAMFLALGAAVFINWYYTSPKAEQSSEITTPTSIQDDANLGDAKYVSATTFKDPQNEDFAEYTSQRQKAHDKAQEALEKVIEDSSSSEAAVEKASAALEELSKSIKRENDLEMLISAKIGKSCVVIIDSGSIKVVTPKGTLTDNITMQIKELILNQGTFSPENITILELNK